jgi:Uma2 family endonuclease
MQTRRAHYDGWTTDDLDALPADGVRRELVDGVLIVTPPAPAHYDLAWRLGMMLDALLPPAFAVMLHGEVRAGYQRSFVPDLIVVSREAVQREQRCFEPSEVALAVEIVAPASAAIDRVLKPALYAAAGMAAYWRIEPAENRLHAYALVDEVYQDVGELDLSGLSSAEG